MSDKSTERHEVTLLGAKLSARIVEMLDVYDPTIFAEESGERFCMRLQLLIQEQTTAFLDELEKH